MKYATIGLLLATSVAAQSISDIPSCALECVASGISQVGCSVTDIKCSCDKASQLTPAVEPCVQKACSSSADQQKIITVLQTICASAGVSISIPSPGASSAADAATAAASYTPIVSSATPRASKPENSVIAAVPTADAASDACEVTTITRTITISHTLSHTPSAPAALPSGVDATAPYPLPSSPTIFAPIGTGTGLPATTAAPSQFTGAATVMQVPAGIAGLIGFAAFLL